jgi:monofunctional biosynthetic peptidoglycan transglycosylase
MAFPSLYASRRGRCKPVRGLFRGTSGLRRPFLLRQENIMRSYCQTTLIILAGLTAAGGECMAQPEETLRMIADLGESGEVEAWYPVNDTVMGGVSSSSIEAGTSGKAIFTGVVSLENNGGFASVRNRAGIYDLSDCSAIRVRLRGDGKQYKFNVRTSRRFDGVNYRVEFPTEHGEWMEIDFPIGAFTPTFHGRVLNDAPALDPSRITSFGFLISDKQKGPFRLEIEWIQGVLKRGDARI